MKKVVFLLAMLPIMLFTSCSSDDDEHEIDYSVILGLGMKLLI